jgi:hypothetical protein
VDVAPRLKSQYDEGSEKVGRLKVANRGLLTYEVSTKTEQSFDSDGVFTNNVILPSGLQERPRQFPASNSRLLTVEEWAKLCTCGYPRVERFPCCHVRAAILFGRKSVPAGRGEFPVAETMLVDHRLRPSSVNNLYRSMIRCLTGARVTLAQPPPVGAFRYGPPRWLQDADALHEDAVMETELALGRPCAFSGTLPDRVVYDAVPTTAPYTQINRALPASVQRSLPSHSVEAPHLHHELLLHPADRPEPQSFNRLPLGTSRRIESIGGQAVKEYERRRGTVKRVLPVLDGGAGANSVRSNHRRLNAINTDEEEEQYNGVCGAGASTATASGSGAPPLVDRRSQKRQRGYSSLDRLDDSSDDSDSELDRYRTPKPILPPAYDGVPSIPSFLNIPCYLVVGYDIEFRPKPVISGLPLMEPLRGTVMSVNDNPTSTVRIGVILPGDDQQDLYDMLSTTVHDCFIQADCVSCDDMRALIP